MLDGQEHSEDPERQSKACKNCNILCGRFNCRFGDCQLQIVTNVSFKRFMAQHFLFALDFPHKNHRKMSASLNDDDAALQHIKEQAKRDAEAIARKDEQFITKVLIFDKQPITLKNTTYAVVLLFQVIGVGVSFGNQCSATGANAVLSLFSVVFALRIAAIKRSLEQATELKDELKFERLYVVWNDPSDSNTAKNVYFISRNAEELKIKKRFNAYLDANERAIEPKNYKAFRKHEIIIVDDTEERKLTMKTRLDEQANAINTRRQLLKKVVSSPLTYKFLWFVNVLTSILYSAVHCGQNIGWNVFLTVFNLSVDFSFAIYYVRVSRNYTAFETQKEVTTATATAQVPAVLSNKV